MGAFRTCCTFPHVGVGQLPAINSTHFLKRSCERVRRANTEQREITIRLLDSLGQGNHLIKHEKTAPCICLKSKRALFLHVFYFQQLYFRAMFMREFVQNVNRLSTI